MLHVKLIDEPGIGAAVAKAFAEAGCGRIAITDINATTLSDTHAALLAINATAEVLSVDGNITDERFITSLIDRVIATFHRIDYSVQCAGVLGKPLRSHETPVQEFDRVNGVNYRGSWLVTRGVLAHMVQQEPLPEHPMQRGAIVNIASQLGIVSRSAAAPYCASKAAVIHMTKSDAIDYSPDGIRVNCVCPGVIATPMTTGSEEIEAMVRPVIGVAPMNRMGTPKEAADPVLFLCSAEASFIQGHALVVDGGFTIN